MANRRMISSATWEDEFIGGLTYFQRCLWIGLFSTCADDQGRLIDNAVVIRSRLFPYDDIPASDIEEGLSIYERAGKLIRYSVKGKKYIQLLKWWENQKPQWAARSKHPSPEGWDDRIRTRENDKYISINWNPPEEDDNCSPETIARTVQPGRQYPIPVPDNVLIPVPDPVVVVDRPHNDNNLPDYGELITAFVEITGIEPNGDKTKWQDAEQKLIKAGCTIDDLTMAIVEMQQKPKYKPSSLAGMVTPTLIVRDKRVGLQIKQAMEAQ